MSSKTLIALLSCAILFLGLALYLVPSTLPSVAPVRGATRTISLAASYVTYPYWNGSSPGPTITVTEGDTVNIMLSSDGSQHQLLVDFDGDGASTSGCTTADKCSSLFMSSTSISFTAHTVGTFHYYCTIHFALDLTYHSNWNKLVIIRHSCREHKRLCCIPLVTEFRDQLYPHLSNRAPRLIRHNFHHAN